MATIVHTVTLAFLQNDLRLPSGASTIRTLKKIINKGFANGDLTQYQGLTIEDMKKQKGVYFKYANQFYRGFKLKFIDDEVYVLIKKFENDNYQLIAKITGKDKELFKMALKNSCSYNGTAKIIGGAKKVSDGEGEIITYPSGEYGISLEVNFFFKEELDELGFRLPKKTIPKPIKEINDYVAFDLELIHGANLFTEIIEIGAIKYHNNIEVARFQTYVKPKQHIPYFTRQITDIDDSIVRDADPIEVVLPRFLKFIGELPLLGHDIGNNDVRIIKNEMCRMNIGFLSNQILDSLKMARETYDNLPNYKLETIKEYLNVDVRSHEAINDCIVSNNIFMDYKNKLNQLTL